MIWDTSTSSGLITTDFPSNDLRNNRIVSPVYVEKVSQVKGMYVNNIG